MNYYLYINAKSGKGYHAKDFDYLNTRLSKKDNVVIVETTSSKDMTDHMASNMQHIDILIFAGGDGTIREALSYCYQQKITKPIGIIPAGTGNDFIRSLNIPNNIYRAIDIIFKGHLSSIYTVKLNDVYFFNIASVGLDAEIVKENQSMRRFVKGSISYAISAIYKMAFYKPNLITLNIDGKMIKNQYLLIAVANGQYYGGGMHVAPGANLSQDNLSIYCARHMPRFKIPYYFMKLQQGKHEILDKVDIYRCKHIVIDSDHEVVINIDGDLMIDDHIDIEIKKDHMLKIFSALN